MAAIDGVFYFTLNYDKLQAWRDVVNADPDRIRPAILGLREGEGHGLPTTENGSWSKGSWVQDLENPSITPWYLPEGRKMVQHQIGYGLTNGPAVGANISDAALRVIKRRCYLMATQQAYNVVCLLSVNEGDRPGTTQGSYSYLGGNNSNPSPATAALVIANLGEILLAMREQMEQLTPSRAGVPNIAMTPSTILVAGPTFAEPRKTGMGVGTAGIYQAMSSLVGGPRRKISALSSHHHQGICNDESTWRYGTDGYGRPPLDSAVSLYHICKAAKDADPNHGLPLIADESNICRNKHVGTNGYPGWQTNAAHDYMRRICAGPMLCAILVQGPSIWAGYATRTGDDKYRYEYSGPPLDAGTPMTMYPSWGPSMDVFDHRQYDINLLTNGVIPITAKSWPEYGNPATVCLMIPSRYPPTNTYASGLAPFNEWLQATFTNGKITLAAGVEKHLYRPVWLRDDVEHTVSVDLEVTSSGGKARLAVMGHDKLDGTARIVSDEVVYGDGKTTVTVAFTPRQHSAFPNVRYAILLVDHNGGGAVEITNWRIFPMAAFNKLPGFVEHLSEGVHNLGSNQLRLALSNTAPGSETTPPNGSTAACILANVSEVDYTYCSPLTITTGTSEQTAGTYKLTLADLVISASGGSVGPFQYIYLYNDTPTSPADPLIGYYNYGSALTLNDGESLTVDFDGTSGVLTLG